MPTFTVEVEFEVFCGKCGAGLCRQSNEESSRNKHKVSVEPCERCLSAENDAGYEKGYDEGYENGREKGRKEAP